MAEGRTALGGSSTGSASAAWGALLLVLALASTANGAGDPTVDWRTIETPHFRIHFDERNRVLARRLAVLAEETHEQIVPVFGLTIDGPTHVVVIDTVDTANGTARAIPYDLIRVFTMAPEAGSTLGDSDDWLRGLFIHEYIHILHLNELSGLWRAVNLVFGKTVAPNQLLPRWYIEGLATYGESVFTEGGRLRNNAYRMYLRMDVVENDFRGVQNLGGFPVEWPGGSVWYLYGSDFVDYVAQRYGQDSWVAFNRSVGGALSPFAVNQIARETFGDDLLSLWNQYAAAARGEFQAEAVAVRARGETAIELLTDDGFASGEPRCRGPHSLGYVRDDGNSQRTIVATELATGQRETWIEAFGEGSFDWFPGGNALVFTQNARHENFYAWNDLFSHDRLTGRVERLTHGERAREPAVSPDGRHVAYIAVNELGGADLRELELATGTIRTLYRADDFELASRPDYSPDGASVVFSLWRLGRARDLFLVDRSASTVRQLTEDRAQDLDPSFSPDGRTVLFASDRTGIFNAYALELESGRVTQLTNVLGGVFSPQQCSTGGPLFVRTYGSDGYDVAMVTDFGPREAPDSYQRPEVAYPNHTEAEAVLDESSYNPWRDLYPRKWSPVLSEDTEGLLVGAKVTAYDPLFHHFYAANATYGFDSEQFGVGASYTYGRLPADISVFFSRDERLVANRLLAETRLIPFEEELISTGLSLFFPFSDERSGHALSLSYAFRNTRMLSQPEIEHDPGDIQPRTPEFGRFDDISLSWFWGDARGFAYSVGIESGTLLNVFVSVRTPFTGADFESLVLAWALRHYIRIPWPWFRGHHLAFLLTGGIGRASTARRPLFAVGGLPDQDLLLAVIDRSPVGAGFLRGYGPIAQVGNQFHLLNVEYRFPLWDVDTGPWTLPLFLRRLYLAGFADCGTAVDELDGLDSLLVGVGAELRLQGAIGYTVGADFRIGYARGLGEGGIHDFYILYGGSF